MLAMTLLRRSRRRAAVCFLGSSIGVLTAAPALAHQLPSEGARLRLEWTFEPGVFISLAISTFLYVLGVTRLWSATRIGGGVRWSEALTFLAGVFTLVVALVSPLHPLGSVLFSAHMTQHELLMLVAAPLLVLGKPIVAFLWALPSGWARRVSAWNRDAWWTRVWSVVASPFAAWIIHAVVLWMWHIPFLFDATLRSEFVHSLQHASFLGSALLFWWALIHGRQRTLGYGLAVLYMFTTALHSGLLGALLTFARTVWYPSYLTTTGEWGLTALEDQQIGGLIMWIPAGLVYVIAGLALFAGWLRESESRVLKQEAAFGSATALPDPVSQEPRS